MIALDKRRVALNLLKLLVLVLFTLNLYMFTSNTLNYAGRSSPPKTVKIVLEQSNDLRLVLVEKNKIQRNNNNASVVAIPSYNDCNYMGYNVSNGECDLVITVKTTSSFYAARVRAILTTWFKLVPSKVYFISDDINPEISRLTNKHLIGTNCPKSHDRDSLACKMGYELELFLKHPSKWYCHFDDDNYVNIEKLYATLRQFDPSRPWYIGKTSVSSKLSSIYYGRSYLYLFATGGAGFCLSQSLVHKMEPYIRQFSNISTLIGVPDDCTVGFIIEALLSIHLTPLDNLHSHLEYLKAINKLNIKDQISLSYSFINKNFVNIDLTTPLEDPTRFKAIHCYLHPLDELCKSLIIAPPQPSPEKPS